MCEYIFRYTLKAKVHTGGAPCKSSHFPNGGRRLARFCGAWPEANREALRSLINDEIFPKGLVCDDCLLAFWERLFASEPKPPWANRPKH